MGSLPPIQSLLPEVVDSVTLLGNSFLDNLNMQKQEKVIAVDSFTTVGEKETEKVKSSVVKIKFSQQEDRMLAYFVRSINPTNWNVISYLMKSRSPRQCRERWKNYLDPALRNDPWTEEEDRILIEKHKIFGSKWGKISLFFNNRSVNSCRNRWEYLKRKIDRQLKEKKELV